MEEDIEDREDRRAEIMTNGLISFQKFLKEFKQVVKDEVIQKINNKFEISYNFRKFNLECYIIDKKYYDEFCKAINFKEISKILSIINEENTEKCKQIIKDKLTEGNFNIDVNDIVFYVSQEDLKKIVGHFNNYSFLNKELLVDCMGVPEEKLKSKKIFVSKNEKNTTLLNIEENFTMSINIEKKDNFTEFIMISQGKYIDGDLIIDEAINNYYCVFVYELLNIKGIINIYDYEELSNIKILPLEKQEVTNRESENKNTKTKISKDKDKITHNVKENIPNIPLFFFNPKLLSFILTNIVFNLLQYILNFSDL